MATLTSDQGTLIISVPAGSSLRVYSKSGTPTVSGSSVSAEDVTTTLGCYVYGPQTSNSTITITTTGVLVYDIVAGDPTPPVGSGSSVTIVNDVTTGGADKALAAEQGKVLFGMMPNIILRTIRQSFVSPGPRRFVDDSWLAADTYAASTLFPNGAVVVNGGNEYIAVTAAATGGTTGAASAPTGTGPGPIVDGTVNWYYRGPAKSALSNAPSFSISTSAPTGLTRFYRNALSTFSSGATTVKSYDGWFKALGHVPTLGTSGIDSAASTQASISFTVRVPADDLRVVVARTGASGYGLRVSISEQGGLGLRHLKPGVISGGTAGTEYVTLTMPSAGVWRIDLAWEMNNPLALKGVYVHSKATVWATNDTRTRVKVGCIADSFGISGYAYYGGDRDTGIFRRTWGRIGCDNVYLDAKGGTGFVAGGANVYTADARITALAEFGPDIVHAHGTVNDASKTLLEITTGVALFVSKCRAAGITGWIVITGHVGNGNTTGGETAYEANLRQAVASAAATDSKVVFVPASGDPAGPWVEWSGNVTAQTGVGNADDIFGADTVHPVQRGMEIIADRASQAIEALLAAQPV